MAKFAFLCFLLLFFSCHSTAKRRARGREIASHHHVMEMKSLVPASSCVTPLTGLAKEYGTPLVHGHGPCSPLAQGQGPRTTSSNETFIRDKLRVNFINSPRSSTSDSGDDNGRTTVTYAGEYVVVVGLGTPKRELTLIFYTGSDITWTQCEGCSACYHQKDKLFDPSNSSTYSELCSVYERKPNPSCCTYSIKYLDGSNSSGIYGKDTLTLAPSNVIPDYIFGCGKENSHDFEKSDGMFGLAQGNECLISQTQTKLTQIFCYCLPSTESSTGYLLFGPKALEICRTTTSTTLLHDENLPTSYRVSLVAITIGNKKLPVPSSHQTIIDSGTVITRVPSSLYTGLQAEFKSIMSKYPASKLPFPFLLDTCYDLTGVKDVTLPKMVLHFGGSTEINLDPSAVVWRQSDSHVCLAFAPNENEDDLIIIGSVLQRKLNILYNIQEKKVGFGVGGC